MICRKLRQNRIAWLAVVTSTSDKPVVDNPLTVSNTAWEKDSRVEANRNGMAPATLAPSQARNTTTPPSAIVSSSRGPRRASQPRAPNPIVTAAGSANARKSPAAYGQSRHPAKGRSMSPPNRHSNLQTPERMYW